MKRMMLLTLVLLVSVVTARAEGPEERAQALRGPWYLGGNPKTRCEIRAFVNSPALVFINERGERSDGRFVGRDRVLAVDWGNLTGVVEPDPLRSPNQIIRWANSTVWSRVPNLDGAWFLDGNGARCAIRQRWPSDRAEFINEKGERVEGMVLGNRIRVPQWGGLEGRVQRNTIAWSNGTSWSR